MTAFKRKESVWSSYIEKDSWQSEFFDGSMYDLLKSVAARVLNRCALVFEGKQISYRQLIHLIEKTANSLKAMGINHGDVVSIISTNMPQVVVMFYAINKLGAIANMINPSFSKREIKASIEKTKSKIILILDQIYPKIADIVWENIDYPIIILTKVSDALCIFKRPLYNILNRKKRIPIKNDVQNKKIEWKSFMKRGDFSTVNYKYEKGNSEDIAAILFSGGTSGTPKGVMLTNGNFNALQYQTNDVACFPIGISARHKSLALIPTFSGFGIGVTIHGMLCFGKKVYLLPKFDFEKSIHLVFKKKIEYVYGVPALFEVMSRNPLIEKRDLSFLKLLVSGGDRLPIELQNRINSHLEKGGSNARIREAYGQTECICVCAISPTFNIKIGSVGIVYPDMKVKIVKPGTTEELPIGETGELCVNGPTVMKGYFNNPEESAKALRLHSDGKIWLHTGDMLSMDEDGYLYYKQRISRMIISSGINIYLNRLEAIIRTCQFVKDVCAVGISDRIVGKRIAVYIELQNDGITKNECDKLIKDICLEKLPSYYQPSKIIYITSFPRTHMGKIDYKKLENENYDF